MFKLVIQDDEGKTTVVPLIRDEITIGRKEGNTIRLTERNVSRRHARIVRNNGEVQIEDLGSYNGIRVNNARIAERVSLRISDQVQIGDYKLYLKAEGVEQVDDARTMPIERVDTNTATDVIPALQAPSTATMPTAAPAVATSGLASAPGTPQLIGNPARTMVAIADTDPAGRPVATAATVAALSASVGYGKLVVLSSNFAGKEFELSRPQMIIGRTDENDICINHRSISRNHAKLVREPETGRYTISDLQSSNGVRVNGQDYGKVELRRGDVVDLGHVRLRFVEPGEDFVFSRDAVITDVPDGGKKGMMIAVVLGVIVLGAVIVYFVTRGPDPKTNGGNGSNGMAVIPDAPEKVAAVTGSNDGSAVDGSNGSDIVPTITPDAPDGPGSATNPVGSNPPANSELEQKCLDFQKAKEWSNLQTCANTLEATNPKRAGELNKRAVDEAKALTQSENLTDAIKQENLEASVAAMNKIPRDSVYHAESKRKFDAYESKVLGEFRTKVRQAAAEKNCKTVDQLVKQAPSRFQPELRKIQCEDRVATGSNNTTTNPPPAGCQSGQADGFYDAAKGAFGSSQWAAVILNVDKAIACGSPKADYYQLGGFAACLSNNAPKAKYYYNRLSGSKQNSVLVKCAGNKIQLP